MKTTGIRYTNEQKEHALVLAEELGCMAEAARTLGLGPSTLYRWRDQAVAKKRKAAGEPKLTPEQRRIRELEKELHLVRQERDFLKKAAAYFAQEDRKPPTK